LRGKKVINVELDLETGNFDLKKLAHDLEGSAGKTLFYMTTPSAPSGTMPTDEFITSELIPFARRYGIPIINAVRLFASSALEMMSNANQNLAKVLQK
jgi:aspartate/methionine/tyrosine aminotransferase